MQQTGLDVFNHVCPQRVPLNVLALDQGVDALGKVLSLIHLSYPHVLLYVPVLHLLHRLLLQLVLTLPSVYHILHRDPLVLLHYPDDARLVRLCVLDHRIRLVIHLLTVQQLFLRGEKNAHSLQSDVIIGWVELRVVGEAIIVADAAFRAAHLLQQLHVMKHVNQLLGSERTPARTRPA